MSQQLGAQMHTIREFTQDADSMFKALKKVREIGYEAVQLSSYGKDIPANVVKDALQEAGLACASTHINFLDCMKDIDKVIADHKLWGCDYVGVGSMPNEYRSDAAGFERFAKEANKVGDELAKAGLKFFYHNHCFEFNKFDGKLGMDILFDNFNENVQFEIDTFWVQKGASDVRYWLEKVSDRMEIVHFKDMRLDEKNEQIMAEIGQGNLYWPGIIKTCKDLGFKLYYVEQDFTYGRDPFESLKLSYDFLAANGVK